MQVLWFGWVFLNTYSGWAYPFPRAGIYSCKFSHSGAQRAAALPARVQVQHRSLCKGLKLVRFVMLLCMEEALMTSFGWLQIFLKL